jgi:hypothetical protein
VETINRPVLEVLPLFLFVCFKDLCRVSPGELRLGGSITDIDVNDTVCSMGPCSSPWLMQRDTGLLGSFESV